MPKPQNRRKAFHGIGLTDLGVAVGLVAVGARSEKADVVDPEIAAEVVVVCAAVEMLPREVEVGDASSACLHAAGSGRVSHDPVTVKPSAVVVPAKVVVDASGECVLCFLTQHAGHERTDVGCTHITLQPEDVVRGGGLDEALLSRESGAVNDRRIDVGVLTPGDRRQRTVGPLRALSGDLRGAQDRRFVGLLDNRLAGLERQQTTRRSSDAA